LVELHEGTVTASSGGAGRGATFTVTLPAGPEAAADPGPPRSADPASLSRLRLDGVRVVVVDDEPDARELLAAILEGQGATVTIAASAAEALRAVEREAP